MSAPDARTTTGLPGQVIALDASGTPTWQTAPHAHEFPCQPPDGDLLAPGDCLVCGKPYALDVAEKRASEAGLAVVDPADLRAALTAKGTLDDGVYDRLAEAAGVTR